MEQNYLSVCIGPGWVAVKFPQSTGLGLVKRLGEDTTRRADQRAVTYTHT